MKTIFITGTSSGIGRAAALMLDSKGFTVIAGVRNEKDQQIIKSNLSAKSHALIVDITDSDSVEKAAKDIEAICGDEGLYGLLNNAGISEFAPIEAMSIDKLRSIFEVNLFGAIRMTNALIPQLRKSKGRIINVCSMCENGNLPFSFSFSATKSGLDSFTKTLRAELLPWSIDVVSINPSSIVTRATTCIMNSVNSNLVHFTKECKALYSDQLIKAAKTYSKNYTKVSKPPEIAAKTILKAFLAKNPKKKYPVGCRQLSA